jgi:hypothetical protein
MVAEDTYTAARELARTLQLIGEWDSALDVLDAGRDPELYAEIAMERWFFQIEKHDEAEDAVAELAPDSPTALLLTGRMTYSRLLFDHNPRPDDRAASEAAYRAAVAKAEADGDEAARGWAEFHWAVLLDNIDGDFEAASPHYDRALEVALKLDDRGDLESIVIRHQAQQKESAEEIRMLRRSLHLRAAMGARPRTLAAQAALAHSLPEDDPERAMLMEIFRAGAEELRIGWLLAEE